MRLLLVEDDELLGDAIRVALAHDHYVVEWARDGLAAERALRGDAFDLVLLDLQIPGRAGLDILKSLRAAGNAVPVLILTARDTVRDRVIGLDAGADDYLVKPFDLDELHARVRALMRRGSGRASAALEHGDIRLDPEAHTVAQRGEPVELSPREFALLRLLLENAGRVLSRGRLEEALYGGEADVGSNAVEVHVHHLRRKLGADLIHTVRGVGYLVKKAGA
ncbi:transcriptional regulator [Sulfurifustis variabilis]|uniref:Transcriptional regulator n=1 Tax=Sulfurifustis variabilis TaxID=1675686 RepID=A0A1B4V5E2_9GAMM|nr:response regulator transcription factor [Sulfurifustis variabilis]BAU48743.1 transcriptional regulator [Sulfurifustis variabilis]